jgi:endonuclease YncB( thermonuclease family)
VSLFRPLKSLALAAGLFAFWINPLSAQVTSLTDDCVALKIDQRVSVDAVYDGGTFLVGEWVVKLTGVHVPVAARHLGSSQPLGKVIALEVDELMRLTRGQIKLEYDQLSSQKGRILVHAYLEDGRNLALTLLENGFALVDTQLPNTLHSQCYRQAEARARSAKVGLWQFQEKGVPVMDATLHAGKRQGFQIVRGNLVKLEKKKHYLLLIMDTAVLRIPNKSLKLFDQQKLFALQGKTIEVRDEFTIYRNHMVASLEHPGQINLLADAFYESLSSANSKP